MPQKEQRFKLEYSERSKIVIDIPGKLGYTIVGNLNDDCPFKLLLYTSLLKEIVWEFCLLKRMVSNV